MDKGKIKISTIKLDQATRARVAKELGVPTGIDWVPEEITFMTVDPEEAGRPEVEGHAYGIARRVVFNPAVTPNVTLGKIAGTGYADPSRLLIVDQP